MNLKPLQHHEAVQLIETNFFKSELEIQYNTDWLIDIAGLFPHTLQLACYIAFEYSKNSSEGLSRHYAEIEEQFYVNAIPFFEECWHQFDDDHKRVMEMVCKARKLKPSQKYLLDELIRQNYIIKEDGYLQPFSTSFERFIADKCGFRLGGPYEQHRFMGEVRVFLEEKYFCGVKGLEITDRHRVVVAATAVRLIFHLDISYLDKVKEVEYMTLEWIILQRLQLLGQTRVQLFWLEVLTFLQKLVDEVEEDRFEFINLASGLEISLS